MSEFNDELPVELHFYNGVSGVYGREYYSNFLGSKHQEFQNEIQNMLFSANTDKINIFVNSLSLRIADVLERIGYFAVPTNDDIRAMQNHISTHPNGPMTRMRNELNRMQFFADMAKVQRYYAGQVKTYIDALLSPVVPTQPETKVDTPEQASTNDVIELESPATGKYVYGLNGLRELLKIGHTTASQLANSEKLAPATIKNGRKYIFETEKVLDIMRLSNQPKSKRPPRKKKTQND